MRRAAYLLGLSAMLSVECASVNGNCADQLAEQPGPVQVRPENGAFEYVDIWPRGNSIFFSYLSDGTHFIFTDVSPYGEFQFKEGEKISLGLGGRIIEWGNSGQDVLLVQDGTFHRIPLTKKERNLFLDEYQDAMKHICRELGYQ